MVTTHRFKSGLVQILDSRIPLRPSPLQPKAWHVYETRHVVRSQLRSEAAPDGAHAQSVDQNAWGRVSFGVPDLLLGLKLP